jgi:hypothetical protein
MVVLVLSTTIISCSQALDIINRFNKMVGFSNQQKIEIISELKKVIPSCPIKIESTKK